jgi:hypothetical protein
MGKYRDYLLKGGGSQKRSVFMKNTSKFLGIIALVAVIGALTSCALERSIVKNTPKEQRASVYLKGQKNRIDKIDGKGVGFAFRQKTGKVYINGDVVQGSWKEEYKTRIPDDIREIATQLPAGEHTLSLSGDAFIGRKNYTLTYNFEAGKRYLIDIRTDPSLSFADAAAATLKGDYIVVVTDMDAPKTNTFEINIDLSGGR